MVTEERRPYNVGAVRTDPAERRTFRRHVPDPATQWSDIIGADETAELGDPVTYQVWLTEEGRAAFQAAVDDPDDNGRFIEEDQVCIIPAPAVEPVDTADTHLGALTPSTACRAWSGEIRITRTTTRVRSVITHLSEGLRPSRPNGRTDEDSPTQREGRGA